MFNKKKRWFKKCLREFEVLDRSQRFGAIRNKDYWPCLNDRGDHPFDTHYEYHLAWAARCLAKARPSHHTDIGSLMTFSMVASAFVPITFYDYRPAKISGLANVDAGTADLTALPFADNSIKSLSCMHTIEHIGLGRYGDKIDPDGDVTAIRELQRVLAPGGDLLFVVPIGAPRIQFNAHRIYSHDMITKLFKDFELVEYALIPDNAHDIGIIIGASKELTDKQRYACGCFWFRKKK